MRRFDVDSIALWYEVRLIVEKETGLDVWAYPSRDEYIFTFENEDDMLVFQLRYL